MTTKVLEDIAAERDRQIGKGYSATWDDRLSAGELSEIAAHIIMADDQIEVRNDEINRAVEHILDRHGADVRKIYIIAAALIVAEIERLDRLASRDIESTTDPDSEQQDGATFQTAAIEGFDPITQTWKPIDSVGKETS